MSKLFLLNSKNGLGLLLVALFAFNYAETQLEEQFKGDSTYLQGFQTAQAFQEMEGGALFKSQHLAPLWSVAGFSFSYFLLLPILLFAIAASLWKTPSIRPFRIFTFSLINNYILSLPFFIFFPVPERWAYPDSGAILLSDLLSTQLIEWLRPISGLDNCFPSIHVSFSMLVILISYHYSLKYRHSVFCLGLSIILSTFALGIHWGPDMIFGLVTSVLSFTLALNIDQRCAENIDQPVTQSNFTAIPTPPPKVTSTPIRQKNLVFISYRRDQGSEVARIVQTEMGRRGISCFLDVENLGAEHFGNRLLNEIEAAPNFILILSPGSLDRCTHPEDWLRKEVAHALKTKRNIIPLVLNNFQFPDSDTLPDNMKGVERHNGVSYSHNIFWLHLINWRIS